MGSEQIFQIKNGVLQKYSGVDAHVEIPESVTKISKWAFYDNIKLEELVIPQNVNHIQYQAFFSCGSLRKVTLKGSCRIEWEAFYCKNMEEYSIDVPWPSGGKLLFGTRFEEWRKCARECNWTDRTYLKRLEFGDLKKKHLRYVALLRLGDTQYSPDRKTAAVYLDIAKGNRKLLTEEAVAHQDTTALNILNGLGLLDVKSFSQIVAAEIAKGDPILTAYALEQKMRLFGQEKIDQHRERQEKQELKKALRPVSVTELKKLWAYAEKEDGTLSVYGYKGKDKEITVPGMIGKKTVSSVDRREAASYSFSGCTSVILEEGITEIGEKTFYRCYDLEKIQFPDGLKIIKDRAFCECSYLESAVIPESVRMIGYQCFSWCKRLKDIGSPKKSLQMGTEAFMACGGLADNTGLVRINDTLFDYTGKDSQVVIPDGIKKIDKYVFNDCSFIESISIPDTVTEIGSCAFRSCSSLKGIVVPEKVKKIEDSTFYGCSSLKEVALPDGLEQIGSYAFNSCRNLESIVIPEKVQKIEYNTFSGCRSLKSVSLPLHLIDIGDHAFDNCSSLQHIEIPKSVTDIRDSAFSGCQALESFIVPKTVRSVRWSVFQGCTSLRNLDLPKTTSMIGEFPPSGCEDLADGEGMVIIHQVLYRYVGRQNELTIPDGVTLVAKGAFSGHRKLKHVTIPDSVQEIGDAAFQGCKALKCIVIPDSVQKIGVGSFNGCGSLTEVSIPDGIEELNEYLFKDCRSLREIEVPESVKQIDSFAFENCVFLKRIEIPNSVQEFGWSVFSGCKDLTIVGEKGSAAEKYASEKSIPFLQM